MGDLNINWTGTSSHKDKLTELFKEFDMTQKIQGFTYTAPSTAHESLLDLCFVHNRLVTTAAKVLATDISDHYATTISLQLKMPRAPRILISCRNNTKGLEALKNESYLNKTVVDAVTNERCPDKQVVILENWVSSLVDKYAPLKTIRIRPNSSQWIYPQLKRDIAHKNRLFKKATTASVDSSESLWNEYKAVRNKVQSAIKNAKVTFHRQFLTKDSSTFFKQAKHLLGKTRVITKGIKLSEGLEVIENTTAVAEIFNNVFTNSETTPNAAYSLPDNYNTGQFSFVFAATSEIEVAKYVNLLKPSKRGGYSQIPAAYYKCLSLTIVPALTIIINNSFAQSKFPSLYKQALVTPIYKKKVIISCLRITAQYHRSLFFQR